ncbi:MAG: hypothetical protein AAF941_01475 [Pseudomonadota bacterium]
MRHQPTLLQFASKLASLAPLPHMGGAVQFCEAQPNLSNRVGQLG